MPKCFAILVVLLTITCRPSLVQGQKTLPTSNASQSTQNQDDGNKNVTISATKPLDVKADVSKNWIDTLNLILTFGLVVVGAYGVRYAKKTLEDVRIQAEAARRMTDHLVTADRAWVIEKIDFPKTLPFQRIDIPGPLFTTFVGFEIDNVGKTLARIKNIRVRFHTVNKLSDLPTEPDYGNPPKLDEFGDDGFLLIPGRPCKIAVPLSESFSLSKEQAEAISAGSLFLCTYGLIEYESVAGNHETRFSYRWYVPAGIVTANDTTGFRKSGPSGYNCLT